MRLILQTIILSSLIAGCSALQTPLYSAWYIQNDNSKTASPQHKLYVTLLNRSEKSIEAKNVILNRGESEWELIPLTALSPFPNGKLILEPGKLVVFHAQAFTSQRTNGTFDKSCLLPVEVAIVPTKDQPWLDGWVHQAHGDPRGTIRAELVGRMPSELPAGWETACAVPTKPSGPASSTSS